MKVLSLKKFVENQRKTSDIEYQKHPPKVELTEKLKLELLKLRSSKPTSLETERCTVLVLRGLEAPKTSTLSHIEIIQNEA